MIESEPLAGSASAFLTLVIYKTAIKVAQSAASTRARATVSASVVTHTDEKSEEGRPKKQAGGLLYTVCFSVDSVALWDVGRC